MKLSISIKTLLLFILLVVFSSQNTLAQQLPPIEAIQSMSSDQLQNYWKQAQDQGYTLDQIEQMARLRGVSEQDIQAIKQKLQGVDATTATTVIEANPEVNTEFGYSEHTKNYLEDDTATEQEKSLVFGKDFFNNPKINLEPNLNIAVSKNYQLGPGDEISIDVWGAAQKNYTTILSKQGTVVIENLAPIYLNGLTLNRATTKIKSKLATVYSGIGEEVGADVYLNKARSIVVNIIGQVETPGTYSISSLSTAINALYAAGGPSENGSFRAIELIRNGKKIATLDIYEFLTRGKTSSEFLQDNDVILVPTYQNRIQVEGYAKINGFFELKDGETAADLLNFNGGFASNAYKGELFVERIDGLKKKMISIHKDEFSKGVLKDGDRVLINNVTDEFTNKVSIEGEVNVEGSFPMEMVKDLKTLILKAQGFSDHALLSRGLIYREINGLESELESFSVSEVLNDQFNLDLKANDRVVILSNEILKDDLEVQIRGLVNEAGNFEYFKNMKVGDLIALAGGLNFQAENASIDVYRNTFNLDDSQFSEKFSVNVPSDFTNANTDFVLEPKDIVVVRQKEGYFEQETFTINGLVKKPGTYVLTKNRYTLYDALMESGGLLSNAFAEGVYIKRLNLSEQELEDKGLKEEGEEEEEGLDTKKDITDLEVDIKTYLNLSVEAAKLIASGGSDQYNVELKAGDEIIVPKYNSSITINGSVQQPTSLSYKKGMTFSQAVAAAGGYTETAKRSKAYVYYANGKMATKKNFLFFSSNPKLKPGSTIFVPEKSENTNKLSAQEILGITSGISTLGILIKTLVQ